MHPGDTYEIESVDLAAAVEAALMMVPVWATPNALGYAIRSRLLSDIADKQIRTLAAELELPRRLVNGRLHIEARPFLAAIARMIEASPIYGPRGKNLHSRDAA